MDSNRHHKKIAYYIIFISTIKTNQQFIYSLQKSPDVWSISFVQTYYTDQLLAQPLYQNVKG